MNTVQVIQTSEIWVHTSKKPELNPVTQFPSYRFSCPECGSLDVFLTKLNYSSLNGECLDCKSKWEEFVSYNMD